MEQPFNTSLASLLMHFFPQRILPSIRWKNIIFWIQKDQLESSFLNLKLSPQEFIFNPNRELLFKNNPDTFLDLSPQGSFLDIFYSLFPQLNFVDLALAYREINALCLTKEQRGTWPVFFSNYSLNFNSNLEKTLYLLPQLPKEFILWCFDKKINSKDLRSLLNTLPIGNKEKLYSILQTIGKKQPSKSIGTDLIEWSVDLLNFDEHPLPTEEETTEQWHRRLRFLKFPSGSLQLDERQSHLKDFSWPQSIVSKQWQRENDQLVLKLNLKVKSYNELNNSLESLLRISHSAQERKLFWKI